MTLLEKMRDSLELVDVSNSSGSPMAIRRRSAAEAYALRSVLQSSRYSCSESSSWRVDSKRCWKWLKILMTSPRSIRGADAGSLSRCWQQPNRQLLFPPQKPFEADDSESYSR